MALYRETSGQVPALWLVHGWGMHGGVWQPLLPQLTAHFSVTCVDLPGMGHSSAIAHAGLDQLADALAEAMQISASGPVTLCGWSLGGQVAMRLAMRHPTLVERLVLVGSTPRFVNAADWPLGMEEALFRQFAANIASDYQATLLKFLTLQCLRAPHARDTIKQLRDSFEQRPVPAMDTLADALHILLHSDLRAELGQLRLPTLVLHGQHDSLAPPAAAQWLAQQLPQAHYQLIAGAGHAPFLSHPDQFIQALQALQCTEPVA